MKILSTRWPFYSVLAAAFVPWINGLTNSNAPGYFFDLTLICFAGIALALNRKLQLRIRFSSWVFTIFFCLALVMAFILHQMHFLNSFLVIVPVALAYVIFLSDPAVNPDELLRQLKWLYSFHVAFVVLELLLFYFDLQYVLKGPSGDRYRELNFSLLSRVALGFGNGAPNSMLLQAQAAGHFVMAGFLLVYSGINGKLRGSGLAVLILLFLLFLTVINNTSLLIFLVLFATIWMIRANLPTRLLAMFLMLPIAYLFLDEISSTILYQAYGGTSLGGNVFDLYLWLFTVPFSNIADAQPLQLLFGHGSDREALESGELGFATVAYIGGVYLVGLLFIWGMSILGAGLVRYQGSKNARDPIIAAWSSLLFVNIILCAAWVLSAAHYLIVLIPGGLHLFAFGLAIVITANARLRKLWRRRAREEIPAGRRVQGPYGDLSPV